MCVFDAWGRGIGVTLRVTPNGLRVALLPLRDEWLVVVASASPAHALAVAKKFRPRRANTWKHPTPLFPRGLLDAVVPQPVEQFSKAANKNFRRRQNKRARKVASQMEHQITLDAVLESTKAAWTAAVAQKSKATAAVATAPVPCPHKRKQSAMSMKTLGDFNYTTIKTAW